MPLKRMVLEIGMGTDIRGGEPTKAAVRALRDALWHNSLTVANALG
ncbi:MAG: Lin0512 family protein, partial [Alphaproteobacteria bacterium]|nr:Lin0512 family protein [Alphaproteobacteria bacterium]